MEIVLLSFYVGMLLLGGLGITKAYDRAVRIEKNRDQARIWQLEQRLRMRGRLR